MHVNTQSTGDGNACTGTLELKHTRINKYTNCGGWCYICPECGKNHRRSPLMNSMFQGTHISLIDHIDLLWHYTMVNHRVCKLHRQLVLNLFQSFSGA